MSGVVKKKFQRFLRRRENYARPASSGGPPRAAAFLLSTRWRPGLLRVCSPLKKGTLHMTKIALPSPLANAAIADAGRIRMGDCMRKTPGAKPPVSIADSGRIRMGDCMRSFVGIRGR